jgi:hypothetical protein
VDWANVEILGSMVECGKGDRCAPVGETTMTDCRHDLLEWQQQDQGLHCLGWSCRFCGHQEVAEYHHQSWCRLDFCGAEPLFTMELELSEAQR